MKPGKLFLIAAVAAVLFCSQGLGAQSQFAWVLTGVNPDDKATEVKKHNINHAKSYYQQIEVKGNGINLLKKYVGKSQGSTEHGEHLGVRVEWSKPPNVIQPGENLDLSLAMEVTSKYVKSLHLSTQARVDMGRVQKNGKLSGWSNFTSVDDSKTNLFFVNSRTNFAPVAVTVRRKVPSKAQPQDQIGVCVSASNGIQPSVTYIYTWQRVSKEVNKTSPFDE